MNLSWIDAIAFAVSGAVVYGAVRLLRRPKGSPEPDTAALRVVTRTRVGIGRTLVLVEVDGRRILLGSTKEHWAALADLGKARGASTEEEVFEEIEDELLRASNAARHRRRL